MKQSLLFSHLAPILRGMISNFSGYDESDPLTANLLKDNEDKISEDLLKKERERLKGSEISRFKLEYTGSELMNGWRREKLIGVANSVHAMQQIETCCSKLIDLTNNLHFTSKIFKEKQQKTIGKRSSKYT